MQCITPGSNFLQLEIQNITFMTTLYSFDSTKLILFCGKPKNKSKNRNFFKFLHIEKMNTPFHNAVSI